MKISLHLDRRALVWWGLGIVCAIWTIGAAGYQLGQRETAPNPYLSIETKLAECRELRGSQARYDCVSELLVKRDARLFDRVLFVVLPPLVLLAMAGGVAGAIALRRERARQRELTAHALARMAEYREQRRLALEAEARGEHREEVFLDDDGKPVETPARFLRRREPHLAQPTKAEAGDADRARAAPQPASTLISGSSF